MEKTNSDSLKIKELKTLINKYDKQYYEEGVSEISDAEYDRLYDEYLKMEEKYPELASMGDAPTRRVGAGPASGTTSGLPKFTHKSPLLSINRKAKEMSELRDFFEKCGGDGTEFIIEPKLDGITCNINYENGKFVNAATRGNGYIGDLITENFKMTDTKYPDSICGDLEIRGEAIIPYDYFVKHLKEEYSNPRNAVAGIMRQIDAKEVKNKGVQVMFYDIGSTTIPMDDRDPVNIRKIKDMGFQSVPAYVATCWESLKEIVETGLNGLIQQIDGFNILVDKDKVYPQAVCDGLVIKVASLQKRKEIGFSEKGPKWAFAYKFKPLQAKTRIDHVEWQVGKTGRLVPVAVFDEISLGGTKITRATLNNYSYMQTLPVLSETRHGWTAKDYDNWGEHVRVVIQFDEPIKTLHCIKQGDVLRDSHPEKSQSELSEIIVEQLGEDGFWIKHELYNCEWYPFEKDRYFLVNQDKGLKMDDCIVVERSNDVIPRVIAIDRHQHFVYQEDIKITRKVSERQASFDAPTKCPICGHSVAERTPLHYCTNPLCKAQLKGRIEHFVSRDAMNIVGFGSGIIGILYEQGLLTDIPSIFTLKDHRDEIEALPKFAKKKVGKLLQSIEAAKKPALWQFIYSLSIDGVGHKAAKDLAQHYGTLEKFLKATAEEMQELDDFGSITVQTLTDSLSDKDFLRMVEQLLAVGVDPQPVVQSGHKLQGMTFVITGTLEKPRSYYQDIIEKNGGKVTSSVSKKTTAVLIGNDAGSKETKARELVQKGVEIALLDTEDKIKDYLFLSV